MARPNSGQQLPRLAMILGHGFALAFVALPAFAESQPCMDSADPQRAGCKRANADIVVEMPVGENTEEGALAPGGSFQALGFSISKEQEAIAGAPSLQDQQRAGDIAAAQNKIDVRFDGLDQTTILNVSTTDLRAAFRGGDAITFRTTSNYPQYISHAKIIIADTGRHGEPVIATLPAPANGTVAWTMPANDGSGDYSYVLRVYDAAGRYDETIPLDLHRSASAFDRHATSAEAIVAAGEGEDRTRMRAIPIRGGRITVAGEGVEPGSNVRVRGEQVPLDPTGHFVLSRILPAGDQVVDVEITGKNGQIRTIKRDVTIPTATWFKVGIVDLTFGSQLHDDAYSRDPDAKTTNLDGRLAFYAKGSTQSGYSVTTSIDTGEGSLEDAFHRLSEKDPMKVLRRLDPMDSYPTYGDDSKMVNDAPSSGRFYFRIEHDASSAMWGDFKSTLDGTKFFDSSRALNGAKLRYVASSVTVAGAPQGTVTLYAAQPDTLPQRDILRGTGGSVYFLSHQDVGVGTETLMVEVADPMAGRVISRRMLTQGVDYKVDYMQGV
ncbi:MAG: TonB-dependent receptor, partial [Alphaproteobacteria bacterium]|nr:TonB-dependent receptor [Alphaproteobacteria bacterium]